VALAVAAQLIAHGIDAITAHSIDGLGKPDQWHLFQAASMNCILCTHDTDFLRLHQKGLPHTGIVFARHESATISVWVNGIRHLYTRLEENYLPERIVYYL
jgi:hypothetical protein